ncbi:MAG: amino acid transporter, partial [Lactococcus lactis]|nr:amino acid transporter [Lactococcus lactis]
SCTTNLFLVVYFITLYTYWQYRKSDDYNLNGFLTPKPAIAVPFIAIIFAIVFASLFFNADTFYPALGAIVWTLIFGLYSHFKKI